MYQKLKKRLNIPQEKKNKTENENCDFQKTVGLFETKNV